MEAVLETKHPMKSGYDPRSKFNGISGVIAEDGSLISSSIVTTGENHGSLLGTFMISLSMGGLSFYLLRGNPLKNSVHLDLTPSINKIISPSFDQKSSLFYLFLGQDITKDKQLQQEIENEVLTEIYDFKFLLNPVRLALTKLLYENMEFITIELKEKLSLSWNDLNCDVARMRKKDYLHVENRFIDGTAHQVVTLMPATINVYKSLKDVLLNFLTSSKNLHKYVEVALDVRNRETSSNDLYPN